MPSAHGVHGDAFLPELVRDVAALTHGNTDAHEAAVAAAQVAGQCQSAATVRDAIAAAFTVASPYPAVGAFMSIDHAQQIARHHPAEPRLADQSGPGPHLRPSPDADAAAEVQEPPQALGVR